jgi:hypothetical protein
MAVLPRLAKMSGSHPAPVHVSAGRPAAARLGTARLHRVRKAGERVRQAALGVGGLSVQQPPQCAHPWPLIGGRRRQHQRGARLVVRGIRVVDPQQPGRHRHLRGALWIVGRDGPRRVAEQALRDCGGADVHLQPPAQPIDVGPEHPCFRQLPCHGKGVGRPLGVAAQPEVASGVEEHPAPGGPDR